MNYLPRGREGPDPSKLFPRQLSCYCTCPSSHGSLRRSIVGVLSDLLGLSTLLWGLTGIGDGSKKKRKKNRTQDASQPKEAVACRCVHGGMRLRPTTHPVKSSLAKGNTCTLNFRSPTKLVPMPEVLRREDPTASVTPTRQHRMLDCCRMRKLRIA